LAASELTLLGAAGAWYVVAMSEATGPLIACYVLEMVTDEFAAGDEVESGRPTVVPTYKVLLRSREVWRRPAGSSTRVATDPHGAGYRLRGMTW
jgi:hypothetical protein